MQSSLLGYVVFESHHTCAPVCAWTLHALSIMPIYTISPYSMSPYQGLTWSSLPPQYRPLTHPTVLTSAQGKVAELRLELNSSGGKKDKNFSSKKVALKKIVANMTMSNNDMVALFPDIVGVMGTQSLEIKKM